jgi:hypothetical protein
MDEDLPKALNLFNEKLLENLEVSKEIKALVRSLKKQTLTKLIKEEWLDGQDVIQAFHITRKSLNYLRNSGKLPFTTLHEKYIYKYSDIGTLLKKNYSKIKSTTKRK